MNQTLAISPGSMITIVAPKAASSAPPFFLGVNTHLGWPDGGYSNIPQTIKALQYLGVKHIRDSCTDAATIPIWQQVASQTGAKFCDFMPEGSPALCQASLTLVPQLAHMNLLDFVEGCNEPDDDYAIGQGMSLVWATQFQQQVHAAAVAASLPSVNLSVGAGWVPIDNWIGDYPLIGDQSQFCTYANAHTYPQHAAPPAADIQRFTVLAKLGALVRPTIHTEFGYPLADVSGGDAVSQELQGQYVTQAVAAAKTAGAAGLFWYGLYDDRSGRWGLFNNDGTPRPSATALKNAIAAG